MLTQHWALFIIIIICDYAYLSSFACSGIKLHKFNHYNININNGNNNNYIINNNNIASIYLL